MKHFKKVLLLLVTVMLGVCCFGLAACGEKAPEKVDVNSIQFDGSSFTWGAVENATMYIVDIDGIQKTEYTNKHTASIGKDVNELTIKIIAKNDVGQSEEVGKYFTRLETIDSKTFTFDSEGVLSWNAVTGATGYVVRINGTDKLAGDVTSFSEFEYGSVNEIKVRATGADGTFSTFSDSVKKRYLGVPSGITYDGTNIKWTRDANAKGYIVYINGNPQQSENALLTTASFTYEGKATFNIKIVSVGDGKDTFSSKESDEITCSKLEDVKNLKVEEGILKWDEVDGAQSYKVKVGKNPEVTVTECAYDGIKSGEEVDVQIKPLTDAEFCFSNWCNSITVFIIESPVLRWNEGTSGSGTKSLEWDSVSGAEGYSVRVTSPNGSVDIDSVNLTSPSYANNYSEVGEYKVEVSAITATANQYNSKWSTPYYIRRLAAPEIAANGITSDPEDFESGFKVNFSSVSGAKQYKVYNGDVVVSAAAITTTRTIKVTYDSSKTEMVYGVQAIGTNDSTNKIVNLESSKTEFKITILTTPTDLSVVDDSSNIDMRGVFTWKGSSNSYVVKVQGKTQTATDTSYEFKNLSVGENKVTVCAKGDGQRVLSSPYAGVITVYKLSAPTNIKVNTKENEGTLSYDLTGENATSAVIYFNGDREGVSSTSIPNLNDSKFDNTDGITVIMRAIGTGTTDSKGRIIISSDPTDTKTFYKLKTIDVTDKSVQIDGYTLKWTRPSNVSDKEAGNVYYEIFDSFENKLDLTPSSPELDMSNESKFACGKTHSLKIRCMSKNGDVYFNSDFSDTISVTKLAKPTLSVNSDKNGYTWEGVANATGYTVTVDTKTFGGGDFVHNGVGTYNLTSDKFLSLFVSEKTYNVSIVALGNANELVMNSNAFEWSQPVNQLKSPVVSVRYSEERVSTSGELIATVDGVANANGYTYYFNKYTKQGEDGDVKTCKYPNCGTGKFNVYAIANGGLFDDEENFYISSQSSTPKTITLYDAVSVSTISKKESNKTISLSKNISNFDGNLGYTLVIEYFDKNNVLQTSEPLKATSNIFNYKDKLPDIRELSEEYPSAIKSVTIWANGNGSEFIASMKVTKTFS